MALDRDPFRPNPLEVSKPLTIRDAMDDTLRYAWHIMPVEKVVEQVLNADADRIMDAASGRTVYPPLSSIETLLAQTVEWCSRNKVIRTPMEPLVTIAVTQVNIKHFRFPWLPRG